MNKNFVLLFNIKTTKKNSEGLAPIYLRLTIDGERVEISTKRSVEVKKWNKVSQKVIGNSEEARSLNMYLKTIEQQAYNAYREIMHHLYSYWHAFVFQPFMYSHTLFPVEPVFPEGFVYYPDFISEKEEMDLCREISKIELHTFIFQGYEAKRSVASFGQDWSFEKKSLSKGKDIPVGFHALIEKIAGHVVRKVEDFAELLVTEYPVGSLINWHRDAPPFDLIAGISLLSDCMFRLRPYDKARQNRASIISFPVKRRSLYVMQGPSRVAWQHSIAAVENIRYSITLRTLRN